MISLQHHRVTCRWFVNRLHSGKGSPFEPCPRWSGLCPWTLTGDPQPPGMSCLPVVTAVGGGVGGGLGYLVWKPWAGGTGVAWTLPLQDFGSNKP